MLVSALPLQFCSPSEFRRLRERLEEKMTKFTTCVGLTVLLLSLSAGQLRAQGAAQSTPAAAPSDPLQLAGSRLFQALADNDLAVTAQNTPLKYARKLTTASLRPAP